MYECSAEVEEFDISEEQKQENQEDELVAYPEVDQFDIPEEQKQENQENKLEAYKSYMNFFKVSETKVDLCVQLFNLGYHQDNFV